MSERLTTQDLAVLEHMRSRTTPGEWFISEEDGDICATVTHTVGEMSLCEEVGSLDSDNDNCFTATAHEMVPRLLAELRARRQADLSDVDHSDLHYLIGFVEGVRGMENGDRPACGVGRGLSILDRLLAGKGR